MILTKKVQLYIDKIKGRLAVTSTIISDYYDPRLFEYFIQVTEESRIPSFSEDLHGFIYVRKGDWDLPESNLLITSGILKDSLDPLISEISSQSSKLRLIKQDGTLDEIRSIRFNCDFGKIDPRINKVWIEGLAETAVLEAVSYEDYLNGNRDEQSFLYKIFDKLEYEKLPWEDK